MLLHRTVRVGKDPKIMKLHTITTLPTHSHLNVKHGDEQVLVDFSGCGILPVAQASHTSCRLSRYPGHISWQVNTVCLKLANN